MTTKRNITVPEDLGIKSLAKDDAYSSIALEFRRAIDENSREISRRLFFIEKKLSGMIVDNGTEVQTVTILGNRGGSGSTKTVQTYAMGIQTATMPEGLSIDAGRLIHVDQTGQCALADSGADENDILMASGLCVSVDGREVKYAVFAVGPVWMLPSDYDSTQPSTLYLGYAGRYTNKASQLVNRQNVGNLINPPYDGFAQAVTLINFGYTLGPISAVES